MAAVQSLVLSSTIANMRQNRHSFDSTSLLPRTLRQKPPTSFYGQTLHIPPPFPHRHQNLNTPKPITINMSTTKPSIQFIQGTDEQTIPGISLTKSKDGTNGVATFIFEEPSVFDSSSELGDITGIYMIDEEGVIQSTNVSAKFVNGKPSNIEAKYVMRSSREWDRFMRFMERYSNANGLEFVKK